MKKVILAFIILITTILMPVVNAEQFETLFKMDNEVKDNTVTIQLGLREGRTMAVMSNIVYNQEKLEFVSIDANEYFTVTKSNDMVNGVFKSFKILADSDYGFEKVYYANVTFKIKENFQKGERTDIYFNNNQVATADEEIKTSPSMVYTLFYDQDGTVSYVVSERNFMTTVNIYLANNWKYVLIGLGVLFGLFLIIRYYFIAQDVISFRKKHNHNHIVNKMKFARVPANLQTLKFDDKPEKVRPVKIGKWFKKKDKKQVAVEAQIVNNQNIANLMAEEKEEEVKEVIPERGYFVGNQDMGNDNQLPDDFSSFGEATANYAYDDDKDDESEFDDADAANLDNLSNISLTDENNNQGSKLGILFLGLLVLTSLFNIKQVNALNEEEMSNLRNMILGNMTWSSEYDINNDNTIDMLDIIALKDINNITIIQDSITVEDSKPQNNFVLKSTSKYVRTTKQGQTKMRTTADGKWKTNNGRNNSNNNNQTPTNPSSSSDPVAQDPIVKEPESVDVSDNNNNDQYKCHIRIHYANGYGEYDNITVNYNGSITFNVYAPDEGHQNLTVFPTSGKYKKSGSYPTYEITLYDIVNDTDVNISFGVSSTINARIKTGTNDYDYKNQSPGSYHSRTLKYDTHYTITGIYCNGGFENYKIEGEQFSGYIASKSGTCTLQLKPKHYEKVVKYNGNTITNIKGDYGKTINNVSLWDSALRSDKLKLYCGGSQDPISPKKVEWHKETSGGVTFEGYRYFFDVVVTGNDCELR